MNPSATDEKHYQRVKARLREATPTGMEVPRLSMVELILCEMLGEQQAEINNLKARLDLRAMAERTKK